MRPWKLKGKWAEGAKSSLIVKAKGSASVPTFQFVPGKRYSLKFTVDGKFSKRGGIRIIIGDDLFAVRGNGDKAFDVVSKGGSGLEFKCKSSEFVGTITNIAMKMGA